MRKEVNYVVVLSDNVRKRHIHETLRGEVIRFAVQLEWNDGRVWKTVVRYDNAHGFSHRDLYDNRGNVKKDMLGLSLNAALTYGDWDISQNWERYIKEFKGEHV